MNIAEDFTEFLSSLSKAIKKIESHYFRLPVAGKETPIYRERVYCYELYHQLRQLLGDNYLYKLDGEIDKAGNPYIENIIGPIKPDFVLHVPGSMDMNLAVIEVKSVNAEPSEYSKDLMSLNMLLDKAGYHYALMLVYGNKKELSHSILSRTSDWLKSSGGNKYFIWHRTIGDEPEVYNLENPIAD